jgi:hypothetical protein
MADSAIWVKVFPSAGGGDAGGPGWDVLTVAPTGPDAVMSWPAAGGAVASYEVSINGTITDVGDVLTYTKTGLSIGVAHTFKVRAKDAGGLAGGWSSEKSATLTGWNAATGGTETTVSDYNGTGQTWKVHTFNANGDFVVTNSSLPFDVLWVGGGGGGTNGNGYSGAGGQGGKVTEAIAVGTWAAVIGGGGTGGDVANAGGGGTTTFKGHSGAGGGGGTSGGSAGGGYNTTNNISGANVNYGHDAPQKGYTNYPNGPGGGGGGAAVPGNWGNGGGAGQVVVAYRIG